MGRVLAFPFRLGVTHLAETERLKGPSRRGTEFMLWPAGRNFGCGYFAWQWYECEACELDSGSAQVIMPKGVS